MRSGEKPGVDWALQLREEVEADLLYCRYFYRSATSETMRNDLRDVVEDIRGRLELKPNDIVVDIGANDATTLAFYPGAFAPRRIEPARNIDWSGVDRSITIINDYFSAKPFEQRFPGPRPRRSAATPCSTTSPTPTVSSPT